MQSNFFISLKSAGKPVIRPRRIIEIREDGKVVWHSPPSTTLPRSRTALPERPRVNDVSAIQVFPSKDVAAVLPQEAIVDTHAPANIEPEIRQIKALVEKILRQFPSKKYGGAQLVGDAVPKLQSVLTEPRKQKRAEVNPLPLAERRWLTVKEAASVFPYSESAFRHLIFQCSSYANFPELAKGAGVSLDFLKCIFRPPGQRRVLLDRCELEKWIASGAGGAK